jgi:hypothetical protein
VRVSGGVVGTSYWATGIRINGVSTVNVDGVDIWGQMPAGGAVPTTSTALDLEASAANLTFITNIVNSNFYGSQYGLYYGPGVQGVTVANDNFTLNGNGIYVAPSTGATAQAQLSVSDCQFDNQLDNILVDAGSTLSHLQVVNNLFYILAGTVGVHIKGGGEDTIAENHFVPASGTVSGTGLQVSNGAANSFHDNMCIDMQVCAQLDAAATGWSIRSNTTNGSTGTTEVVNLTPTNAPNYVVGFIDNSHLFYPNALNVTGAASSGGLIEVTTGASTVSLVKDQVVMLTAPGLTNQPAIYRIEAIPDSSHVILGGSAYGGALTSNGVLSVLP